jgi:S1-C subfamily serine protease
MPLFSVRSTHNGGRSLLKFMLLARSRLVTARTIAISLMIGPIVLGACATMVTAGQPFLEPSLGSASDYVKNNPDFANTYEIPLLGIEVDNETDSLKDGHEVSGVEVLSTIPSGPGAVAGLQGRREGIQAALTLGIMAGAVFFPPAMLGVVALQQSGIGQSHELIIAIDGQRTRDITDFREAIEKAEAGEFVYLTVLSHGEREQLRVELPVACLTDSCRDAGASPAR